MNNDVVIVDDHVPAFADDTLLAIAKMAEARIDAVIKIKQLALKVTNASDWTDQQDKPYVQASGSEKIANLFNISVSFLTPEPLYEQDTDGHYTFTFKGRFSMGGRSIEVEGSRSSRDPFFKQNTYENDVKREKTIEERDNKRDVRMAAYTNLMGNGITRLLGIRNLTWEDLEKFAGIKKDDVSKVKYKNKNADKAPVTEPQKKGEATAEGLKIVLSIANVGQQTKKKDGSPMKSPLYIITAGEKDYKTFSETFAKIAKSTFDDGLTAEITYTVDKYGNNLTGITKIEPNREPGAEG